jgi:hypothetical protein
MIANALRLEIERYAARMPSHNPLFKKAEDGTFTAASMVRYLTNVRYLCFEAQGYLDRAGARALELGDVALAEHYANKRREERGHEEWADRDIERVTSTAPVPLPVGIVPAIDGLLAFLRRSIDEDPAFYLSYILFSEYLIVLLGTPWLLLLEERCGIPRTSMTIVGNHIELDREHVVEALDDIDALVGDPAKLPRMREALLATFAHFDAFCEEVTQGSAADSSQDALRQISAA